MKATGLDYPHEIEDAELSGRVLAALARDGQVRSEDVQVLVEDGVVTLLGTVDTPYERDQAERLARAVEGVTYVDNRLAVAIEDYRTDAELLAQVEAALATAPELAGRDLGARISHGVVTLFGRVDSLAEEQAAIDAASRVKGVREVVSALRVGQIEPTTEPVPVVDDAVLLSAVNAAMADAGVTIYENESEVRHGVAYLRGLVRSRDEVLRAVTAARAVPGLQGLRVALDLQAHPSSRDQDEALVGRVIEALRQDGRVSPAQVIPTASDGIVVLSGQVESIDDQVAALEVVARVPGVRKVIDDIRILGHAHAPAESARRARASRRAPGGRR